MDNDKDNNTNKENYLYRYLYMDTYDFHSGNLKPKGGEYDNSEDME